MTNTEQNNTSSPIAFKIAVTLASSICLSANVPAGNVTQTLSYIPGSAVRGMLAEFYLDRNGDADETFERLFLSGEVTFGNLYLSIFGGAFPTPLSARSCKHEPGFKTELKHGVIDLLIKTFVWKWAESKNRKADLPKDTCIECDAPLERFVRFYERSSTKKQTVPTERLRRIITRSATDNCLQTTERDCSIPLKSLIPRQAESLRLTVW
jgi:hypothetical protein